MHETRRIYCDKKGPNGIPLLIEWVRSDNPDLDPHT